MLADAFDGLSKWHYARQRNAEKIIYVVAMEKNVEFKINNLMDVSFFIGLSLSVLA